MSEVQHPRTFASASTGALESIVLRPAISCARECSRSESEDEVAACDFATRDLSADDVATRIRREIPQNRPPQHMCNQFSILLRPLSAILSARTLQLT
jgi:hypothetical protein